VFVLVFSMLACGGSVAATDTPPPVQLAWNLTFENDKSNLPPPLTSPTGTKMGEILREKGTLPLPFTGFGMLDYQLPTRTALIKERPYGLPGKALCVQVAPNDPGWDVGHSRGPRLGIDVPVTLRDTPRWRLSFDLAAGMKMQMGTLTAYAGSQGIFMLAFYNTGLLRLDVQGGTADVCPYVPNKPLHIAFLIDNTAREVSVYLDKESDALFTAPWSCPEGWKQPFTQFTLMGMSTGPHGGTGSYAIDNIRLEALPVAAKK
jgi:hypothetical protein